MGTRGLWLTRRVGHLGVVTQCLAVRLTLAVALVVLQLQGLLAQTMALPFVQIAAEANTRTCSGYDTPAIGAACVVPSM